MVRHLRRKWPIGRDLSQNPLACFLTRLHWVIDRLHFQSHSGCKDRSSPYYVEEVNPQLYPDLKGVDTEAAEQICHVASRWQVVLSNSHSAHQAALLVLFAREHNKSHDCQKAAEIYQASGEEHKPRRFKRVAPEQRKTRTVKTRCEVPPHPSPDNTASANGEDLEQAEGQDTADDRTGTQEPTFQKQDLGSAWVYVTESSGTVHHVAIRQYPVAGCGFYFGAAGRPIPVQRLKGDYLFTLRWAVVL